MRGDFFLCQRTGTVGVDVYVVSYLSIDEVNSGAGAQLHGKVCAWGLGFKISCRKILFCCANTSRCLCEPCSALGPLPGAQEKFPFLESRMQRTQLHPSAKELARL